MKHYFSGELFVCRKWPKTRLAQNKCSFEVSFMIVCPCMMIDYYSVKVDILENFNSFVLGQNACVDWWTFQIVISPEH